MQQDQTNLRLTSGKAVFKPTAKIELINSYLIKSHLNIL